MLRASTGFPRRKAEPGIPCPGFRVAANSRPAPCRETACRRFPPRFTRWMTHPSPPERWEISRAISRSRASVPALGSSERTRSIPGENFRGEMLGSFNDLAGFFFLFPLAAAIMETLAGEPGARSFLKDKKSYPPAIDLPETRNSWAPGKKQEPDLRPASKVVQFAANIALWSFFVNFFLKSFCGHFKIRGTGEKESDIFRQRSRGGGTAGRSMIIGCIDTPLYFR